MQPTPGPTPPPSSAGWPPVGAAVVRPPADSKAVAALVLGTLALLGTFCLLGPPLGVPAVVFGVLAHRDIARAGGMAAGRGMATAGIVLGSFASLVFAGWMGFVIYDLSRSRPPALAPPPAVVAAPTPTPVAPHLMPPGGWGRIHVIDLSPATGSLRQQLLDEQKAAKAAGETVLVETVGSSCIACVEIARAMRDAPLQAVLAPVRLVHVDVGDFGPEAAALRMNERALPWFYLLDARGDPRDGVSADEWDDNDAAVIAPVLDDFLHGRLRHRRRARWGTSL